MAKKAKITVSPAKDGGIWVDAELLDPDPSIKFLNGKKKKRWKVPASTDGAYNQTKMEHAIRGAQAVIETKAYSGSSKKAPGLKDIDLTVKGEHDPIQKEVAEKLAVGKKPPKHPSVSVEKGTTTAQQLADILSQGRPIPKGPKPPAKKTKGAVVSIGKVSSGGKAGKRYNSPFIDNGKQIRLPSPKDFKKSSKYTTKQMSNFIDNFRGWGVSWTDFVDQQHKYLERFGITPDDPRYASEMERLASEASGDALSQMARRTHQRTTMALAADGNPNQMTVWLDEGDENTCDYCASEAGNEMTYADRLRTDTVPGVGCYGGNRCRCEILAVD